MAPTIALEGSIPCFVFCFHGNSPIFRFHDLSHTFVTLAIQQGMDVKMVSGILGHYSAGFTLDTYTHVTGKMQKEAADRMGGFIAQTL